MDWLDAFREHLKGVESDDLNPPATPESFAAVEAALASPSRWR